MSNTPSGPTVSVIIPAYNAEEYIESALDSVRSQSLNNIEIIIVNDGSTDSTQSVVGQIASSDPRITLISQAKTGKPSIARNVGISRARGKYIAFMDADDIMLPGKLEAQADIFENNSTIALIFHDWCTILPDGGLLQVSELKHMKYLVNSSRHLVPYKNDIYFTGDKFYNFMSTNDHGILTIAVMIRRAILEEESEWFPENMDIGEDLDLWNRLLMKHKAAFIDRVYCQYRKHPASITTNTERFSLGLITAQERNLERGKDHLSSNEIRLVKQQLALKYIGLGYYYYLHDKRRSARKYYRHGLCLNPRIKYLRSFIKTFLPFKWVSSEDIL